MYLDRAPVLRGVLSIATAAAVAAVLSSHLLSQPSQHARDSAKCWFHIIATIRSIPLPIRVIGGPTSVVGVAVGDGRLWEVQRGTFVLTDTWFASCRGQGSLQGSRAQAWKYDESGV